jgi:hypothetical protein
MNRLLVTVAILSVGVIPITAAAQVIPTSEWVNLWSSASTLNSNPIPKDAVIRVFDPDDVLCGEYQVDTQGSYGLVPVYRDDPFTINIDEGAEPGDTLRITLNGFPASTTGPDAAVWTQNGAILQVNLAAEGIVPTSEWVSFWSDVTEVRNVPVPPGAVIRAYDPSGILCGEFVVTLSGSYGLMSVYRDDALTFDFDEGADPGDIITFTIDDAEASPLGPDTPVWSANGEVKHVSLRVELVSTFLLATDVRAKGGAVEVGWTLDTSVDPQQMALFRRIEKTSMFEELVGLPIRHQKTSYSATDRDALIGITYFYQLRINSSEATKLFDLGSAKIIPPPFGLLPNYPNPFRHSTTLRFGLAAPSYVTLVVYNAEGRSVRRLLDGRIYPSGTHEVAWDGLNEMGKTVPVGVYFIRLRAGGFQQVRKTLLLR